MNTSDTAENGYPLNEVQDNRYTTTAPAATGHYEDIIEDFSDESFGPRPKKGSIGSTPDGLKREFVELNRDNKLGCNLTELGASNRIDEGYMSHTDWIGHASRYGYAMKQLEHGEQKNAARFSTCDAGASLRDHLSQS